MLSREEAATIRAALRYWADETAPHGVDVARHYVDEPVERLLDRHALEQLAERFAWGRLREISVDSVTGHPPGPIRTANKTRPADGKTTTWTIVADSSDPA